MSKMFKEFSYLVKLLFHNKPKDCKDLEIINKKNKMTPTPFELFGVECGRDGMDYYSL